MENEQLENGNKSYPENDRKSTPGKLKNGNA